MRLPCELVQDILPLYVEEDVNPKTRDLVEKHLEECGSCQDFLRELKNEEPVLDNIPENLPEPDTFKKWLKRLRIGAVVGLIALILAAVGIGVVGYKAGTVAEKETISTRDVVKVLKKAGLSLKASQSPVVDPSECILGDVQPKVYGLDEEGLGQLYIYEFDSTLGRRNVLEGIKNMEDDPFARSQIPSVAYAAKNMVIIVVLNISEENWQSDYGKIAPITQTLGKTIFHDLNQGEKWVLYGDGKHWEAKLVVSAYEEWWTGEDGYKKFKFYMTKTPLVKYKGNPEEIKDINYSFEYLTGKSTMAGEEYHQGNFDEEQTGFYNGSPLYWGIYGGTTHTIDKNETGKFSVQWSGEEESFELTLQEP
ncbi:putative integral membrane protein (DUF2275) [Desulfitobacterium dehalogenans ATCC 51507]|uniref:Putative integral membrane protein (DUF2275) n=1 Tax=Desulfitobacterium dehalogenans (strain ATCC 51507 / DSM 9161 / JW/IU-DC1) TaxID=756499 RepID=I4A655_DESDJ|nr:DUF2275 domain-containing protein [Desulfitobacterium dehalogenans]AFL99439.1 putative integral membrane protein (DUF2275) [Desulfitobacterium dehalogenans ATCC 51507]